MGPCNTKHNTKPQKEPVARNSPPRIPTLKIDLTGQNNDSDLIFEVSISSLKAKNINPAPHYVRINFDNHKTFKTDTVDSANPHWKLKADFLYKTNTSKVKNSFFTLTLVTTGEKEVKSIRINLFDLATGPIHNDYSLEGEGGKTKGRIIFDVKMSQKIHISLKTEHLFCHINHENLLDKVYSFTVKIISQDGIVQSDHSKDHLNPLFVNKPTVEKSPSATQAELQYFLNEEEDFSTVMNEKEEKLRHSTIPHINRSSVKMNTPSNALTLRKNPSGIMASPSRGDPQLGNLHSSGQLERSSSMNLDLHRKDLIWDFKDDAKEGAPIITAEINCHDFSTTSLKFTLWSSVNEDIKDGAGILGSQSPAKKYDDVLEDDDLTLKVAYFKLIGECYWSLNKLFRDDFRAYEANDKKYIIVRKEKLLSENLWKQGNIIGYVKSKFLVESDPFLQQMFCGVRTETGEKLQSSFLFRNINDSSHSKASLPTEIKDIMTSRDAIIAAVFSLYDTKAPKDVKMQILGQKQILREEVVKHFDKLMQMMRHTNKEAVTTFYYRNADELIKAQSILLELGKHLIEYADEFDENLRGLYYECLKILCNRAEFELGYMGFDEGFGELLNQAANVSFKKPEAGQVKLDVKSLNQKLKVGLSYQSFLYQTLKKILDKFNNKAAHEKERIFIENFMALAYFRIPEYRTILLNIIEGSLAESKMNLSVNNLDLDDTTQSKSNTYFAALFDWDKDFYRYLKTHHKGETHLTELQDILNDPNWKQKFGKLGIGFFNFVSHWGRFVHKFLVIRGHVPWNQLPGYSVIVKAFLNEFHKRDANQIPEAMKEASQALLHNEKLLNTFVVLIFSKTKVHDVKTVLSTMELVNTWMQTLMAYKGRIPTTFDFMFFLKGITAILKEDNFICIAKCLWMIYNSFPLFPNDFRKEFCELLFGNMFFKLFLHWSWTVRNIFYHLLLFRIYHQHRKNLLKLDKSETEGISKQLLKNAGKESTHAGQRNALINEAISSEYARLIQIIDDAKKNLEKEKSVNPEKESSVEIKTLKQKLLVKQLEKKKNSSRFDESQEKRFRKESLDSSSFLILNSSIVGDDSSIKTLSNRKGSAQIGEDLEAEADMKNILGDLLKDANNVESSDKGNIVTEERNKKQLFLHRKYIYYDKQDNNYLQIPKEQLKYLLLAYKEFENLKNIYLKWVFQRITENRHLSEDERQAVLLNADVPENKVEIRLDEKDADPLMADDW